MQNGPIFDFDGQWGSIYETIIKTIVPGYDHMFLIEEALLNVSLPEQANVLIVGAGGGKELTTFVAPNPGWQFLGVDPSQAMVASAKAKVEQLGASDRVRFHQGFAHDLPNEAHYDGATLNLVMHFMDNDNDRMALLQSIADRLKPGGTFVMTNIYGDANADESGFFYQTLHRLLERAGFDLNKLDLFQGNQNPINNGIFTITETHTLDLLRKTGFDNPKRFYSGLFTGGWVAQKK